MVAVNEINGSDVENYLILAVKLKMINQDRMIFDDFLKCLEILQMPFSIKILTGVKISENSI